MVDIEGHEGSYPELSRLKLELIFFFKENPGTIDAAQNIATRLGRNPAEVEKALDELACKDICVKVSQDITPPVYAYRASTEFLRRVSEAAPDLRHSSRMELLNLLLARDHD